MASGPLNWYTADDSTRTNAPVEALSSVTVAWPATNRLLPSSNTLVGPPKLQPLAKTRGRSVAAFIAAGSLDATPTARTGLAYAPVALAVKVAPTTTAIAATVAVRREA
jgi:hypothetical protein